MVARQRRMTGKGTIENERPSPLRVGGRKQGAHRAAFGLPEQRRALRADGIHDRPDVIHAFLEGRNACHPVGQPGAAFVEPN